ncbi:prolyl oligopeptidase family serine peptidase [Erythrobacter aquimaris]|uniref:Prolyl oligopeptidase family serine peptidase n=1 Tax=Qipengyuania aquimaris TaxID=255984 RepID=A0A6I4TLS5_9SPHN|nr:S9 family peptidase [Qipengyuania aquimaris]MXO96902.1 prolyl oligopeptidase family serine peptidase [Qipengyuania aquimaris]
MTKNIRAALPLASALALLATPLAAQDAAAPMSAQDLVTMPRLGSPAVNPEGTHAVYAVTTTDPESYKRTSTLYLRSLAEPESAPIALDIDGGSASFADDNWLYFMADGEGDDATSQVWRARIAADGTVTGKSQVTALPRAVHGYRVSPNGEHIAIWTDIARTCTAIDCDDSAKAHLPGPGDGRLYEGDGGFYRHWDSWETPGTLSRVFTFPIENGVAAGTGTPVDGPLGAGGPNGDTPTMPFGGGEDVAWASDGKGVFFTARETGAGEPYSTNLDIWFSDLSGNAPVNLTAANEALDALPTPSPDGQYLAYVAMARPTYEADRQVVMLRDLKTGVTTALTSAFDRSFQSLAWTPDSRWLVAGAQDVLDTPAYRIDPRDGSVERLDLMAGNEARISDITPLHGGDLVFTRNSIGAPSEMYLSRDWGQAKPMTQVAADVMERLAPVVVERFSFTGAGGDTVWGQITKLDGHEGPMPAILYVHGGPQGSFNDGWSSRWNPRVVASQGYAVISVDFHGSTGYGQAFTDSIRNDWGGKPLEDLQLGLAAALEKDSQIDGTRACAMGASYGGYMMNWIAGQWPDRFDCLVQHDGLFDMRSFYYTTEELWFPKWEFGGSYAENSEAYERWNPVNYVENWQTPMLVIAGEQDFRVPYTQGLASFTALQERQIPSQLLVFPTENHWVLGAKNSLQWHKTVFAWLDRWLKPESDSE